MHFILCLALANIFKLRSTHFKILEKTDIFISFLNSKTDNIALELRNESEYYIDGGIYFISCSVYIMATLLVTQKRAPI